MSWSLRPIVAAELAAEVSAQSSVLDEEVVPDGRRMVAPIKGRGTATQLAHRFEVWARERVADGWQADSAEDAEDGSAGAPDGGAPINAALGSGGQPAQRRPATELTWHPARSILSRSDSPDIPFDQAVNPYRGCEHGCVYCYARPTHSYLNLSPGLDFETRILGKSNSADLLRRELSRPGHVVSPINIGSATDVYQPVEREAGMTRQLLEVLDACQHPFTIVTKSALVMRDIDLLQRAARRRQVYVMVSVTTLDSGLSRVLEPRAAAPLRRLQAVRALAEAGVPVGVNVAPIIPFINEPEIEAIVAAAAAAGARAVHYTVLRLPWEVRPLFEEWLHHHHPLKAARVMARLEDLGDGQVYSAEFGARMKGRGVWGQLIAQRMARAAARHGLSQQGPALSTEGFVVPPAWRTSRGRAGGVDSGSDSGAAVAAADAAQQSLF